MHNPDACTRCGGFLQGAERLYTEAGDRTCPPCFVRDERKARAVKLVKTVRSSAYVGFLLAVGSVLALIFFRSLWLWPLGSAALSSGGALAALAQNDKLREDLGAHLVPVCLSALLGVVIAGACLALGLLAFAFRVGANS